MHSVILTELGISVFDDDSGRLENAFPFSDPVAQYLRVKGREARLEGLVSYLGSLPQGVAIAASDESLRAILQRGSVDTQIMDAARLERVQASKPQIMVDSGFASDTNDALGRLREFALGLSSHRVAKVSASPDLHVIQAINSLDEVDRIANALNSRLREWYGLHFPELDNVIDSIVGYAQIAARAGRRQSLTGAMMEEAKFPESKTEMLSLIADKSRGGEISDANLAMVQSIAQQILDIHRLRRQLEDHVAAEMAAMAPNLSAILGTAVGARMLARAGSLKRLASMPSSTIQVLGAERALFLSLKAGSNPPKHGLLFQHSLVHAAPRWQRGKIARAIAAKAAVAARVDVYGDGLNRTLLEKLNVRVGEIGRRYENPPEGNPRMGEGGGGGAGAGPGTYGPGRPRRRDGRSGRGGDGDRRRAGRTRRDEDGRARRADTDKRRGKAKKRRQFARR